MEEGEDVDIWERLVTAEARSKVKQAILIAETEQKDIVTIPESQISKSSVGKSATKRRPVSLPVFAGTEK